MYVIKDFCEKSLKELKDTSSLRNIFLSYALCGNYANDPEFEENLNKLNFYLKRYSLFEKKRDYMEIQKISNECLLLINRTLATLESEMPKISSYETINRKEVSGFFAVKVMG